MRHVILTALLALAARAADTTVAQSAARVEELSAKAPKALAIEYRLQAAQALADRYPELSRKTIDGVVRSLRADTSLAGPSVIAAIAGASLDDAIALYNEGRAHGRIGPTEVSVVLGRLVKERPEAAVKMFQESLAAIPDPIEPGTANWIINAAAQIAGVSRDSAIRAWERVLDNASAPDYGKGAKTSISGQFQIGSDPKLIEAASSRDAVLLNAGGRLRMFSPEEFAKYKEVLSKWNINGPVTVKRFYGGAVAPAPPPEAVAAISRKIGSMRGLATDADRARLVLEVVPEIQKLPADARLNLIRGLANVSTEGDLGKEALTAVAVTLAGALRESMPNPITDRYLRTYSDGYLEVAKLVRYERVKVPGNDPAIDAANAVLDLRERVQAETGFSLTDLAGKTWSLNTLKGKIVLLNFWATWCPPCRKEMPDMEKLYRNYEQKGLIVLAVSDEQRPVVEAFLAKNPYSFPILLDPDRKVNTAFTVEGIPKSFIFDREGRLAAMAIDMRTESQFMELLKQAGL